jgi:SIR2-like domain
MASEWHQYALDVAYVRHSDAVPADLSQSIDNGKCVLFIGAGASLGAVDRLGQKLPSWGRMVGELVKLLDQEAPQDISVQNEVQDLLNLGELLALSEWIDSELNPNKFAEFLEERLGTARNSQVHDILARHRFAAVVTTNYDALVEEYWRNAGQSPIVVTPHMSAAEIGQARRLLNSPRPDRIPIIKPHGTWERPDTLVFGPRTYRQIMFANDSFRAFMSELFTQYTVLFVGLSFKDPNLQSLLQWTYTLAGGRVPTHYATMENRGAVFKRFMLNNFRVRILTYPVPPTDHSACLDILRAL